MLSQKSSHLPVPVTRSTQPPTLNNQYSVLELVDNNNKKNNNNASPLNSMSKLSKALPKTISSTAANTTSPRRLTTKPETLSMTSTKKSPKNNNASSSSSSLTASSSSLSVKPPPPRTVRVSDRLNPKTVAPLGFNKSKSAFSASYSKGAIPCRLVHGSVHHTLSWTQDPSLLPYNPLLVTFFEGIIETDHPYCFLVKEGIKEMLRSEGAYAKVCGVLRSLVKPLRIGLMSSHKPILVTSLQVLRQLTTVVGPQMIPFLGTLLPPLASKVHNNEFGEDVMECLRSIEMIVAEQTYQYASPNDGEDLGGMILKIIKSKVPTYTTVYF